MSGEGPVRSVVVVGTGHAAVQAARSLRAGGFDGPVTLIGAEASAPYERPPLSKDHLTSDAPTERLLLNPAIFYEKQRIDLTLGDAAAAIDRAARAVVLASGRRIPYDRLVIATGADARPLPASVAGAERALSLRSLGDCHALRGHARAARRIAVIGAGYIGLELAASLRKGGAAVTVIEAADRALARAASTPISGLYEAAHRAWGVRLLLNARVAAIEESGVVLGDGSRIAADAVIAGVGSVADDRLARAAGLDCAGGVLVDGECRTSDPNIFAIGDVALPHVEGTRLRLESVAAAMAHGKIVAAAILGKPAPEPEIPWFWSDQYDLKLQIVGLRRPGDAMVVRRREDAPGLAVLHARDGRLVCVEAVNDPKSFMAGRKLIADPAARIDLDRAADGEIALADAALAAQAAA